jgi:hypothetical protein
MSASLLWSLAVRGEDNDSGSSSSMKIYKDMKIMHNISRIPKKKKQQQRQQQTKVDERTLTLMMSRRKSLMQYSERCIERIIHSNGKLKTNV